MEDIISRRKWTDLFSANRLFSEDTALKFIQPEAGRVVLGEEDVNTIKAAMGDCLVGRFVGRLLGWPTIKEMA